MKDTSSQRFVEKLLMQDSGVSDARMQEERTRLVSALETAERKEKAMRRAVIIACVLLALMVVVMSAYLVLFPVARFVGGVITFILLIVAGTLLALYNDKYRPAVTARRDAMQTAVLADLQRQIQELKKNQSGGQNQ